MFKNLQHKALKKTCNRLLLDRDYSQLNSKVKRIGFLVNEDKFTQIETLKESYRFFEIQPKNLSIFSFVTFKKKAPSLRQDQLTNKDFSWRGTIESKNALDFLNESFDVLVGYYEDNNPYLDIMMAQSSANFKVGVSKATPEIFDFLLDIPLDDFNGFSEELKKYLKVLGKL